LVYSHDGSETTSDFFDIQLSDGVDDGSLPVSGRLNLIIDPDGFLPPIGGALEAPVDFTPENPDSEGTELEVLDIEGSGIEEGGIGDVNDALGEGIDAFIDPAPNSDELFPDLDAGIVIKTVTYDFDDREQRYLTDSKLAKLGVKKHNTVYYTELPDGVANLNSSAGADVLNDGDRRSSYQVVANKKFVDGLTRLDNDFENSEEQSNSRYQVASDAAVGVSISVTAGILAWVLRGGALFASLMTSTPLWSSIDPVKVIGGGSRSNEDNDEPESEVEKYFS